MKKTLLILFLTVWTAGCFAQRPEDIIIPDDPNSGYLLAPRTRYWTDSLNPYGNCQPTAHGWFPRRCGYVNPQQQQGKKIYGIATTYHDCGVPRVPIDGIWVFLYQYRDGTFKVTDSARIDTVIPTSYLQICRVLINAPFTIHDPNHSLDSFPCETIHVPVNEFFFDTGYYVDDTCFAVCVGHKNLQDSSYSPGEQLQLSMLFFNASGGYDGCNNPFPEFIATSSSIHGYSLGIPEFQYVFPIIDSTRRIHYENVLNHYCGQLGDLGVEQLNQRTFRLFWSDTVGHCGYEIAYGPADSAFESYTVVTTTDTSFLLTGVVPPDVNYSFRVRGLCCDEEEDYWTVWTRPENFARQRYFVRVFSNNNLWGSTTGEGYYEMDETATVEAIPAENCLFNGWSNGSTDNPYSFTVTQNTALIAMFSSDSTQTAIPTVAPLTFTLSPNPTGSLLYVTIPNGTAIEMPGGGTRAEVFDDRGRKVADYKFRTSKFEIDVSTLPDGHYTLRLSSGKKVGTKAFVKQR